MNFIKTERELYQIIVCKRQDTMSNDKKTSAPIASHAAKALGDPSASKIAKSLAGSVLSQSSSPHQTSARIETIASKALTSEKYSATTKSFAGSALSQSKK